MPEWREEIVARLEGANLPWDAESDVVEELAQHLEDRYQELLGRRVAPEEARAAVLAELAEAGVLGRRLRAARGRKAPPFPPERVARGSGLRAGAGLVSDLRFGARLLRRNPGLTAVAVLTLGLSIGANTAIFSAVNAVVLRPLPFADPGRLYMLWEENPEKGWHQNVAAPANVLDWQAGVAGFQDVAAYTDFGGGVSDGVALTGDGAAQVLRASNVTGNLFSVLGVEPELGRAFRPEETWRGSEPVVVLSHRAWLDRFGGDRRVLGRSIVLDGQPTRVVGVMPAGIAFPFDGVDIWLPARWDPAARTQVWFRRAHWLRAVARLRPGVTPAAANAQLQAVVRRLKAEYPGTNRYMGAGMTPLHRFLVGDTRTPLLVLLAAVALLLLMACANVGNLLLVKAAARQREIALRVAVGARRGRLVRQMLTESLLLSALGGGAGLALGLAFTRLLERLQPVGLLRTGHFAIDPRVMLYLALITAASGLLFGAAPAIWTGRAGLRAELGGRAGGTGRGARQAARALVMGEVALALLLVVGAGLLARSAWRLGQVSPGFDARRVLTTMVSLPSATYPTGARANAFFDALLDRVRRTPGIESAAAASALPLDGLGWTSDFAVAGRGPDDYGSEVAHRRITPGYFGTMRVPLLRGRDFTPADREGTTPVIIINDVLARRYFAGQDPIGQRIAFDKHPDSTSTWRTIVGVVGGERQTGMAIEPQIEIFDPVQQDPASGMFLLVRSAGDPLRLVPEVRSAMAAQDPNVPVFAVRSMEQVRAASLARSRFLMFVLALFACVALVLALVGVYGVTAQVARQQTQEIGVRMALGAQAGDVLRMVVRQAVVLVAGGLALGLVAALMATRALRTLLYQVAPNDPATFLVVAGLLAASALIASWLPARRASRVDPLLALRSE